MGHSIVDVWGMYMHGSERHAYGCTLHCGSGRYEFDDVTKHEYMYHTNNGWNDSYGEDIGKNGWNDPNPKTFVAKTDLGMLSLRRRGTPGLAMLSYL